MERKLILASASPRRVDLLRTFPIQIEVRPSRATELHDEGMEVTDLCVANALRKAEEVAERHRSEVVLGADTLVTLNGKLFGKPGNLDEAADMLSRLSGCTHQVITGVCLVQLGSSRHEVFTEQTEVTFKMLSPQIIREYIAAVPVLDKAGAYGIQERGKLLVEKVSGSLSNVIGLPVEKVAGALCRWEMLTPLERDRIVEAQRSQDPGI